MAENVQDRLPRLLALVPWLSQRPGITLSETSSHFGISVDQLTTDLYQLVVCGVPGYGPDQLVDIDFYDGERIWVTDPQTLSTPMRLTPDELAAHCIALRFLSQLPGISAKGEIGELAAKLDQAAVESGAVSAPGLLNVETYVDLEIQDLVANSLVRNIKISFEYLSGDDSVSKRTASPKRVFQVDDNLYLEAMCDQAEAIRLFRLDRIRQPQLLPDQAADSTDSDQGSKLSFMGSQALDAIHQAPHATIRLTEKTQWLAEENWIAGDPEDPMLIRVPFLSQDWLVGWALSFGGDLQVIEPLDIAARIVDTVCEGIDRLRLDE